jgi:exopolyphosphatase/guanosine-5'-triphosphate,3'-diphosphate pyrophosphatase
VTRVAAIDCGTNTIKLLIADLVPETGEQQELVREMRIVRLGQDVDRTGRFAEEALARTFAAVDEYAAIIRDYDVDAVRLCATSAARDAANGEVFRDGVRSRLGVEPEVVTGDVEAQLSYDGATRALSDVPAPILVVDIGGGSTELILGDPSGSAGPAHAHVRAARSLDIGSVRLHERLMRSDPPTAGQVEAATAEIDRALDTLPSYGVEVSDPGTVVGVAGTITTVAAVLQGMESWDRSRIHHVRLPVADVHALTERLLSMTVAEREQLHVPSGRSDVIGAGALILSRVLRRTGVDSLLVSDSDILDGIAWSLT